MKRWVAAIMIGTFGMGAVLSGCGGDSGSKDKTATSASPGAAQAAKSPEPKAKEPVKFSVFVGGSGLPTPDKDPILQQLNKDLNMDMEFTAAPSDYAQQLNVKIAGGTPPDVFILTRDPMKTYSQQGVLLELGPYLDKMPNIKQTYTDAMLNMGRVDGKLFAIPARPDVPGQTFWIRNDWLANVGLKSPATTAEFKQMLIAFTDKDPDGNGKKDTYGLTGNGLGAFSGLFSAFGTADPGQYMIVDNKVVYSTTAPQMKEALAFIAELVALKVVDPEIMANQGTKDREKAIKGQAGALYRHWGDMGKTAQVEEYKSINPKAEWVQLDALTGPGGKLQGIWDKGQTPGRVALSKSLEKNPDKLNKVLEYLNYITDPGKGQTLVNYGIEGTNYKVENGKIVVTNAANYSILHQLTRRNEQEYLSTKFPAESPLIKFAVNQPRISVYKEFVSPPSGVVVEDKTRYETEELTKFIYGTRPLSQFDDFVKTLNDTYKLPLYLQQAEKDLKAAGVLK
ncbi:extracellular solute-binding protein [Paenibacillus cymbidii]|uniref:extracellular solute-binding protein n=1 Tax=Paenibacillus cymbidii TaxID=1639034 RepID=UPI001436AECA|nr:extracellular solute-binding protein [Paenibacillus cymbidii]